MILLNATVLQKAMANISEVMAEQKDHLIALDQRNGDGDPGDLHGVWFRSRERVSQPER